MFVVPSRERVDFLARVAKRDGGYPGLVGRAWAIVLGQLRGAGLDTTVAPLFAGGRRLTFGQLVRDPTPRRCPTPVGTDDWIRVLGDGADEETDEALT